MKEWLNDLLARWFVPRDDFNQVQERQWSATRHANRLQLEVNELLTKAYSGYRAFEQFGNAAEIKEFKYEDIRCDEICWGWQIRLPARRFYTSRYPKEEMDRIKEYAIEQLTQAFRRRIRDIFYDTRTKET